LRADAFASERDAAINKARERVQRAETGVISSAQFVAKLGVLQGEVRQEMLDALDYLDLLLKQLSVDCHTAYVSTGKFLTIQNEVTEQNVQDAQARVGEKLHAKMEAERREDEDLDDTVEHADKARAAFEKAENALRKAEEKCAKIKNERDALKNSYFSVSDFLRGGMPNLRSNCS
jgi:hypothetical protein